MKRNCILSMSTCCLINFSATVTAIFWNWICWFQSPVSFFWFIPYSLVIVLSSHYTRITSAIYYLIWRAFIVSDTTPDSPAAFSFFILLIDSLNMALSVKRGALLTVSTRKTSYETKILCSKLCVITFPSYFLSS